nr:hypothetical protein [Streptomyces sp. CoH27]
MQPAQGGIGEGRSGEETGVPGLAAEHDGGGAVREHEVGVAVEPIDVGLPPQIAGDDEGGTVVGDQQAVPGHDEGIHTGSAGRVRELGGEGARRADGFGDRCGNVVKGRVREGEHAHEQHAADIGGRYGGTRDGRRGGTGREVEDGG